MDIRGRRFLHCTALLLLHACASEVSDAPDADVGVTKQALGPAPDTSCQFFTSAGRDYWFCAPLRSWQTARTKCQAINLDLVSIGSATENQFVSTHLLISSWIGANDIATEGQWRWAQSNMQFWQGAWNGSAVGGAYKSWSLLQPDNLFNQDCGTTSALGVWTDEACSTLRPYVCEGVVDLCGTDPNKVAPGQCGCGNPDTDSDGDGTANCNDGCVNDPGKTAPGACGCGIADGDADNDGVTCADLCPNDQAKTTPGDCGCANAPLPSGTACDDGLCAANTACNGAGSCGSAAQCVKPDSDCEFRMRADTPYWFCDNDRDYADALQRCQSSGMDLATIESAGEDAFITQHADEHSFIGGSDQATEGKWVWLSTGAHFWQGTWNGSAVGGAYTNFAFGEPSNLLSGNDCMVKSLLSGGQWKSHPCSNEDAFVCERSVPDNHGPSVVYMAPQPLAVAQQAAGDGVNVGLPPASLTLPATTPTTLQFRALVVDNSEIVSAVATLNGVPVVLTVIAHPQGLELTGQLQLQTGDDDFGTNNTLRIEAVDVLGYVSVTETVIRLLHRFHPSLLVVRFDADMGTAGRDAFFAEIQARIITVDLGTNTFTVDTDAGMSAEELALSLIGRTGIAYAVAVSEPQLDQTFPNDERFGVRANSWQLENTGYSGPAGVPRSDLTPVCTTDADCQLDGGALHCPTVLPDSNCSSGGVSLFCCRCKLPENPCPNPNDICNSEGRCIVNATPGADIAWSSVFTAESDLNYSPAQRVRVVVYDQGIFQLTHPDLVDNVVTRASECCANPPCLAPAAGQLPVCVPGEIKPNSDCTTDTECNVGGGESCVYVPIHGRCFRHNLNGVEVSPACATNEECVAVGYEECHVLPATGRCSDGCAGACDVDDDGDGYADEDDPEVQSLLYVLTHNGRDDDVDGVVDDDGVDGEAALVAWDDDENGLIDDVHGFDFMRAVVLGPLFGSTMPGRVHYASHATKAASVVGARVHNTEGITGTHPNIELLAMSFWNPRVAQLRYAAAERADIVTMSWGSSVSLDKLPDGTSTPQQLADYEENKRLVEREFMDGFDPNVLWVHSAGNDAQDLDITALPPPVGSGVFSVPQNLDNSYAIVIAASTADDALVDTFSGGTDYGVVSVDMAAPGSAFLVADVMTESNPEGYSTCNIVSTSMATPLAAGVAGLIISRFGADMRNQPRATIERLLSTAEPIASHVGKTVTGGRVDIERAFDTTTFPLAPRPFYVNESFRLGNRLMKNTHDVDFIDTDGNGSIDYLLEIFGGTFADAEQPRIYRWDVSQSRFRDETRTRLPPNVAGNYNKSAVGDVNGDDCADIVLGGFVGGDPYTPPPNGLHGVPNRLLVQATVSGACAGTWTEDMSFPHRDDITRSVVLFDYDGDLDLDVFFLNANILLPGGDLGDQLLENNGTGTFTDVTAARIPSDWLPPQLTPQDPADGHRAGGVKCDVNDDGFPDLVLAINDYSGTESNRLYMNEPDGLGGRHFVDATASSGFPAGTGFSHDVECHDFTGDGYPEVIFARRNSLKNLYFVNDGDGTFTNDTDDLMPDEYDVTQEVEVCDLMGDGDAEVIFGNGDVTSGTRHDNRMLEYQPATGTFVDAAANYGFDFTSAFTRDLTEDVECADMDGNGSTDLVLIGNVAGRNWLYVRDAFPRSTP